MVKWIHDSNQNYWIKLAKKIDSFYEKASTNDNVPSPKEIWLEHLFILILEQRAYSTQAKKIQDEPLIRFKLERLYGDRWMAKEEFLADTRNELSTVYAENISSLNMLLDFLKHHNLTFYDSVLSFINTWEIKYPEFSMSDLNPDYF